MRIQRDETEKADFDEIIEDFASIKARKEVFLLAFLCNLTGNDWISLRFDGIVFRTQAIHDLH